jgi:hypothetical protein
MPSPIYRLFAQAMAEQRQILCLYDGYPRALCPIILGHSKGEEVALTFQFAGESNSGLPPQGAWKCLRLSKIGDAQLRDGPWHGGSRHTRPQVCVETVDLDVNPRSPYHSRRRLSALRRRRPDKRRH